MRKDYANIYDLPKKDFNELKKDKKYWDDLPPGMRSFADNILNDVKTKELPYVMSIQGGFGSGKTHFITRFCEHIKCSEIEAVYINAFKYDYTDPLLCIMKQISKSPDFGKEMIGVIKPLIKCGLSFFNCSCGDEIDRILEYLLNSSDDDALQKFRQQLSNQILKLKNKRLVLIIDELDRCKPDFSIHLLEILKHVFNIDGLFVILVLNNNFFNQSLKSVYGATFDNDSREPYLDKFTNFRIPMYTPDASEYEKIISVFLEKEKNEDDLLNLLKKVDSSYSLSEIFSQYKISLRQTKIACETACKYIDDRRERGIPSELFLHLICRSFLDKNSKNIFYEYQKNNKQKRSAIWLEFSENVERRIDASVKLSMKYGVYSLMSFRHNDYQWIVDHATDCFAFLRKCSTEEAAQFAESYRPFKSEVQHRPLIREGIFIPGVA